MAIYYSKSVLDHLGKRRHTEDFKTTTRWTRRHARLLRGNVWKVTTISVISTCSGCVHYLHEHTTLPDLAGGWEPVINQRTNLQEHHHIYAYNYKCITVFRHFCRGTWWQKKLSFKTGQTEIQFLNLNSIFNRRTVESHLIQLLIFPCYHADEIKKFLTRKF